MNSRNDLNFGAMTPLAQMGQQSGQPKTGVVAQLPTQTQSNQDDGLGGILKGLGSLIGSKAKPQNNTQSNQGLASALPASTNPMNTLNPPAQTASGMVNNIQGKPTSAWNVAQSMMGMNEVKDNQTLKSFFQKSGQDVDPASTPWCAAFVNGILKTQGQQGTGSLAARSFLKYGNPTDKPSQGDIVVLSRGNDPTLGHVGLYAGTDKNGNILVLGGNQGNSVSVKAFPAQQVLGYRQPPSGQQIAQSIIPKNANPELGHVMQGISGVESGGDYGAVSIRSKNGDRAYGKYQVMGNNIPSWTTQALGYPMTPKQFLADPEAQEKVAAFQLNNYLNQGYSPQDAASMWFTGKPLNKAGMNVKDAYGTTNEQYQKKFNKGYLQSKTVNQQLSMNNVPNQPHYLPNVKAFDNSQPIRTLSPKDIDAIMRFEGGGTNPFPYRG